MNIFKNDAIINSIYKEFTTNRDSADYGIEFKKELLKSPVYLKRGGVNYGEVEIGRFFCVVGGKLKYDDTTDHVGNGEASAKAITTKVTDIDTGEVIAFKSPGTFGYELNLEAHHKYKITAEITGNVTFATYFIESADLTGYLIENPERYIILNKAEE